MDIKLKLRAAEEAAETAESYAHEAQDEAAALSEGNLPKHKDEPIGYRFIQIPKYAFTTDLSQNGEQINLDDKDWVDDLKNAARAGVNAAKGWLG